MTTFTSQTMKLFFIVTSFKLCCEKTRICSPQPNNKSKYEYQMKSSERKNRRTIYCAIKKIIQKHMKYRERLCNKSNMFSLLGAIFQSILYGSSGDSRAIVYRILLLYLLFLSLHLFLLFLLLLLLLLLCSYHCNNVIIK